MWRECGDWGEDAVWVREVTKRSHQDLSEGGDRLCDAASFDQNLARTRSFCVFFRSHYLLIPPQFSLPPSHPLPMHRCRQCGKEVTTIDQDGFQAKGIGFGEVGSMLMDKIVINHLLSHIHRKALMQRTSSKRIFAAS